MSVAGLLGKKFVDNKTTSAICSVSAKGGLMIFSVCACAHNGKMKQSKQPRPMDEPSERILGRKAKMKIIGNLFDKLFGKTSQPPATSTKVEQTPKFLLPETAEEYLRRKAEIKTETAAEVARLEAETTKKLAEAEELLGWRGSPAQIELNARRARDICLEGWSLKHGATETSRQLAGKIHKMEETLRKEEREKIAHQGHILKSTTKMVGTDLRKAACYGQAKEERRVVRLQNGAIFLCGLVYQPVSRKTGREITRPCGYYGRDRETVAVHEPTGEFCPPTVEWVTGSLKQFSEEELRTIA